MIRCTYHPDREQDTVKVSIPDNVISYMVKRGMGPAEAGMITMAVTAPSEVKTLDDGTVQYDGFGASVVGRVDSTGKFFTVSRVKVDTRP